VRFKDLTVASMKMAVFWNITESSLLETDRHLRGNDVMMEALNTYETSISFRLRYNIPADGHLQDFTEDAK
jgi:hypothetical protein